MSADNGIYIIRTVSPTGFEYRVRNVCAFENLFGPIETAGMNLRELASVYGHCQVFTDESEVFAYAEGMLERALFNGDEVEDDVAMLALNLPFPHDLIPVTEFIKVA